MFEPLQPAVFIDRDGTIIEDADYCWDPQQVKLFPGVAESLKRLKSRGFKVIIITNQSGIGRGFFSVEQYRAVEAEVLRQLGDGLVDATYFCPHAPDQGCDCRKPQSGMILQAARDEGIDLRCSFLIGDKESDIECGRSAGLRTMRVQTGSDRKTANSAADWVAQDLSAAAEIVLNQQISQSEAR